MERVAAGWRERADARRALGAAFAVSLALHAALLLGAPLWGGAREPGIVLPGALRARLAPPDLPLPEPVAAPAEPSRPMLRREPRLAPKSAAPPPPARVQANASAPAQPAAPASVQALAPGLAPSDPAPAPGVSAPEPLAAAAGVEAGTPAEAAAAQAAAEEATTIGQYRIALIESARAFRSYPRLARENHWEGRVAVRLAIARGGGLAALGVAATSGYPVLDAQALEMIRRAHARTPVPAGLRAQEFSIEIAVIFDLRDE
jgi:protein TonB